MWWHMGLTCWCKTCHAHCTSGTHKKIESNGAHGQGRATHGVNEVENLHNTDVEGVYIDDLTGETLNNDTVMEARSTEFSTLQDMNVYKYVRRTRSSVSRQDHWSAMGQCPSFGYREVKIGDNVHAG